MASIDTLLGLIDENEVIQLTQEMVGTPSITNREGPGMLNFLKRWFDDLGIPTRVIPVSGDRGHFFAEFGATEGPGRYLFNGHQDTKPVEGMTVDPYAAKIVDGRMYGRGACDMKGAIAGFLCSFKALVRGGVTPKGGLCFYSDIEEEFSGPDSFTSLVEKDMFDDYKALISGEPTKLEIHIGNMGGYVTAFEVTGKAAHSGVAHKGVNAIHHAARFIGEYQKLPYSLETNPYFGKPTINFEKIEAGEWFKATVPDRCSICLDSRLIPETPPELVRSQVNGLIERLKREEGIHVSEVDPPKEWRPQRGMQPASSIAADHPLTLKLSDSYRKALGEEPKIAALPGATFAGVMIRRGLPSLICGPGSIEQAHTEDEWVEVAQLYKAARIYTALMSEM